MSYKCPFCERILSTRSSYSQHISICLKIAEEEDKIVTNMNDMSIEDEEVFNLIEEVYVNLINTLFDFN
jgi:formiminotetrahydrofolate cyclodeaminase